MSPRTSNELIRELGLQEHPEGGYFVLTDQQEELVPTPFADGAPRPIATSIYYLLSSDKPNGVFHMNRSVTYHVLHQGRAEYTLIVPGNPPTVERKVLGTNIDAGESRLLVVGTGVWKMSRLLPEDLGLAHTQDETDRTNCLITEVVAPGFQWEDHRFMTMGLLKDLFLGIEEGGRWIDELSAFVKG